MPEEEIEQEQIEESLETEEQEPVRKRRRFLTRRNALFAGLGALLLILILGLVSVVTYRYGVLDGYIKGQFRAKMADIGIVFDADVFRLTVAPFQLELKNATFNDRVSGEKLFFIRDARIGLTVQDLYAWQLSRDITVDSTEINGAEVWINFDEEGRSNFSNLIIEDQGDSRLNFRYESVKFTVTDATVHFGDLSRSIAGDANNVQLALEPEDYSVPDDQKRYKLDLVSTESRFVYDGNPLEQIDIRLQAIADREGADITELRLDTPIGYSVLNGKLEAWDPFTYNLNVESSVDLTQTSNIFPLGATLRGVGNFRGVVSGSGESYRVEGRVDSDAIAAEGVYLKAVNVAATVEGTNENYTANGTAVAELLTFEDFRIEFPKIAGNVRGTGSDFRWVGELQAAAAKSGSLSLGGLFLSDAVAELRDRELTMAIGTGRAGRFSIAETEFADVLARDLRISNRNGTTRIEAPGAQARSLVSPDYRLDGISGRNLRVTDAGALTSVDLDSVSADSASIKDNRARNIKADRMEIRDLPNKTDITLRNVTAGSVNASGTIITGLSAPELTISDEPVYTRVYSNSVRVAKIESSAAVLGSLNVAGVRLTIRDGRIEGSTNDIEAGDVTLNRSETLSEGGRIENVRLQRPVFVVEPSGRYRASADMSIGGGIVGTIPLGSATAGVTITNESVNVADMVAEVMGGRVNGNATIAYSGNRQSNINAAFEGLDLSKLIALQSGRVIPFEGITTGTADLSFRGTNIRTTTGSVQADISATAGGGSDGSIPVNGRIELTANQGLFNVDTARLSTDQSELTANGRVDLNGNDSALAIALNSSDATEVDRLIRISNVSPDLTTQLDDLRVRTAGEIRFNGNLTGNAFDPVIEGRASLASVSLRDRQLGSLSSDIYVSPMGFELRNGLLNETGGGNIAFSVNAPRGGANNTSVNATLTNVSAGDLLAALPIELPGRLRDFEGRTTGTVALTGLPNEAQGSIDIAAANGTVGGQPYDSLKARAVFQGTRIDIENAEIRVGEGFLGVTGNYDRASTAFDLDLTGRSIPLPLALTFLPESDAIPAVSEWRTLRRRRPALRTGHQATASTSQERRATSS
jgi:hypothetical protein